MKDEINEKLDSLISEALRWKVKDWKNHFKLNQPIMFGKDIYNLNIWEESYSIGHILLIEIRYKKWFSEYAYIGGLLETNDGVRKLSREEINNEGLP